MELLLESESVLGMEEPVRVEELFDGAEKPELVVLVGDRASDMAAAFNKCEIDFIGVNTSLFNEDKMVWRFVEKFFNGLFSGGTHLSYVFSSSV